MTLCLGLGKIQKRRCIYLQTRRHSEILLIKVEDFLGRPEPPRKKRGAIAKQGEKEVELTWAQKYMAKMQEGKVSISTLTCPILILAPGEWWFTQG